ncbi:MAG: FMN-binding protein [Candidatus Izemoplasmatales bacterium]
MFLPLTLLLGFLGYRFSKAIRQYFPFLLISTTILAGLSFLIDSTTFSWLFTEGFLGLAMYVIVMFAGAFPKSSTLSKRWRSVRKEYSILGFIALAPHLAIYLVAYLNGSIPWEIAGVVAAAIMAPLFVMSFQQIKKKMSIHTWNRLQKASYLVYALIFLHLMLMSSGENTFAYILLFALYIFLKLYHYVFVSSQTGKLFAALLYGFSMIIVGSIALTGVSDTISFSNLVNVPTESSTSVDALAVDLADGTYTGTATGYRGLPVSLTVTISGGAITNISVSSYGSTSSHGIDFVAAAKKVVADIIASQSTNVDTVAGATYTSNGIISAVEDALSDASNG